MADRKGPKEIRVKTKPAAKHFSESSPNLHGESKICKCPSGQSSGTKPAAGTFPRFPITIGGNLNPSVAHEFQGRVVNNKNAPGKRTRTPRPVTETSVKTLRLRSPASMAPVHRPC